MFTLRKLSGSKLAKFFVVAQIEYKVNLRASNSSGNATFVVLGALACSHFALAPLVPLFCPVCYISTSFSVSYSCLF